MSNPDLVFSQKGYPDIKVYEGHFEIKESDINIYKRYNYNEIEKVRHYNPNKNFWMQLYIATSLIGRLFSHDDPWYFKIYKKNGAEWTYKTPPERNSKFDSIIKELKTRIK
ncbi:hypothetical protein GCM10027429_13100 [Marivirga atlantica]|jgi:hypothetical protein|uniref:Uncharacterized protein n=1 Tax=Marivirga atlantica TaxID=1548457 RepID=A0A937AJW8_9BACT|nr:hypothetical protein [Marivirga atlantica]MBL0764923.1 hypothetical protein [Marivirga atlantica]